MPTPMNFDVGDACSATAGILVVADATDVQHPELGFRCRYYCRVRVTRLSRFRTWQMADEWLDNLQDPVLAGIRLQEKSWIIV